MHDHRQAIAIFNQCFETTWGTELVRGDDEPIYLPRTQYYPLDRVVFAYGYFASALHEIAHWCIAGDERRKQVDFGYWYNPDGRTEVEQQAFEKVEIKPQSLEWIFSRAANFRFNISQDNLSGNLSEHATNAHAFKDNVARQVQTYLKEGLPERAEIFAQALIQHYRPNQALSADEFLREDI